MLLINSRLVRLHGFIPAEIMLGFVPQWKVTHGDAQGIAQGAMREAAQEEVEEIEEGPEGLKIERMIDERKEQQNSCGPINIRKSHETTRENASAMDSTSSWRLGSGRRL